MKCRNLSLFVVATAILIGCKAMEKKSSGEKIWTESSEKSAQTIPWKEGAIAADTFIKISKIADPAVVNIGTTKIVKRRSQRNFMLGPEGRSPFEDFFGDDMFRQFFGQPQEELPDQKQQSLGSGFVLTDDGYIVTNNHVVEKADEITVTIGSSGDFKAKLIGADSRTDVALIKIDSPEKLSPLALGDSDQLQVGEIVVAIGNPFGLSHTVTQGIVSAKERSIPTLGDAEVANYANFIQTDASINPGNSGGPLLNLRSEVIGINTAIFSPSGQAGSVGIGFAIPINLAKNVITQLREKGTVTRGWLGVFIQKVDPDLAKSLGMKERKGALVSSVQKGSPAEKVGIHAGDVILKFGEKEINEYSDLPRLVGTTVPDQKVKIELLRSGKSIVVEPTIGELKSTPSEEAEQDEEGSKKDQSSKIDRLGLSVSTLTAKDAENLGMEPGTRGVVVMKVTPGKAAEEKGVRPGDVIVELNRIPVPTAEAYAKASKSLREGDTVLLLIKKRGGVTRFVAFRV